MSKSTSDEGEGGDALIHLRVSPALKGRWVRESRAAGMRLTSGGSAHAQKHPNFYFHWDVSAGGGRVASTQPMNSDQFQALAQLLRLRQGPQREAARLVLADGLRPADAARAAGCSASALGNTLRTCRAGLELARLAIGAD